MSYSLRIAIDGPAGAGKSTVSRLVAERLSLSYVDTGAMYRCVALLFLESGIDFGDHAAVKNLLNSMDLSFSIEKGINRLYLSGRDVTEDIRKESVSMTASKVSAIPEVRNELFNLQRDFASRGGVVMEGRDIGTVIMPDADLKIFLTASAEQRAKRRLKDLEARGEKKSLDELAAEILQRDEQDRNREVAPLVQAGDAVVVDNSQINLQETADLIADLALKRV